MQINKASARDAHAIHSIIADATKRGKILKRTIGDVGKSIHHFWVIREEGKIIACCALEIYNKKLAEVRSLVVVPGHEKKGYASALIGHCLAEVKKKKIYEVLAITDRENLFKRLGFSEQLHGQKALFLRP